MSKLQELINAIKDESDRVTQESESLNSRSSLDSLLVLAIQKTMVEIKKGAKPEEFTDLTVINFIIMADKEGYSTKEISVFVKDIQSGEDL